MRELQKKMQQLENDLDQTQEKLMNANQRLEEKEKALQNVSSKNTILTQILFFSLFHQLCHHTAHTTASKNESMPNPQNATCGIVYILCPHDMSR